MGLKSDILRGHTDTIILAQLIKNDSYGYQINKHVLTLSSNNLDLKEATLYSAFRRLESQNFIASYWGDEQTGARRRYYKITSEGRTFYHQNVQDWEEAKLIINKLVEV